MTVTNKEIRDLTGLTSGHLNHNLLEMYINEATAMVKADLGRHITNRFKRDSYQQGLTYQLRFTPVISVDRIFLNNWTDDDILTETTDYTVNLPTGEVTFLDDVLTDGDSIYVEYVPTIFETCIMYQAAVICLQRVHMRANLDARGGDRLESYKEALEFNKKVIKNRPISKPTAGGYKSPLWRQWMG